ncbi:MAG: lipid-binding SYLF domain-containing protein [Acidobacteriota bacterium]|nr:lipid-binding SYLF domain-containing protein [Acidobacteriota bacterium]
MKFYVGLLAAALMAVPMFASDTAAERLHAATQDLHEMMQASDKGIPQDLFSRAQCVAVIPDLKKVGFVVGGEYGSGFFTCRKQGGVGWSAPGSIKITGGKFGFLIGGAETDVIMLVMSKSGMEHLLSNKFKMGGEASAAAGPIGRDASAMTDAELHAEILTYSRQRGLYGGLDLAGSAVTEDDTANKELYGRDISNKEIATGDIHTPPQARAFIHELDRISSRK